ncbi:MAG: hypothetical protein RI965_341 [Bacteroidota bacterium]|jgi:hypothetical protein
MPDLPLTPIQSSKEIASDIAATVAESRAANQIASGKTQQYIRDNVLKHNQLWWKNLEADLMDPDPSVRRMAMIEYNKLQCKVLPNEFASGDESGIVFKVVSYSSSPSPQSSIDVQATPSESNTNIVQNP